MIFKRPAFFAVIVVALAMSAAAQTKPEPASTAANDALVAKVESYLRVLFGWTPDYKVKVGPATPSPIPDLMQVAVSVTQQGHVETGTVYVTKDGRFMVRGEIRDLNKDPFAENRAKIKLGDSPSIGLADAKLTVVEFSDFECPHCQEMYSILKVVEPEFPHVHFVFKNFPLEQLHPWAMTAALAGRCVYKTASSDAFMKFQDTIFENQNAISPDNAWDQITAAAVNAGVSADALHSCMSAPETKAAIEGDVAEGKSLGVESTPTFFINGRLFLAADRQSLEDIIRFDQSRQPTKP
jgi:protein-disulfide isomerase